MLHHTWVSERHPCEVIARKHVPARSLRPLPAPRKTALLRVRPQPSSQALSPSPPLWHISELTAGFAVLNSTLVWLLCCRCKQCSSVDLTQPFGQNTDVLDEKAVAEGTILTTYPFTCLTVIDGLDQRSSTPVLHVLDVSLLQHS